MIRTSLLVAALLAVPGCPPSPLQNDAGTDASPDDLDAASSACARACKNLAALGCSEGTTPNCVATCQHTQSAKLVDLHPVCLADAKSKAAARGCGSVTCE
jgi:hypothetical protein